MTKKEILADEVMMIEDGGEMPEVAFNASLYFLIKDPDGPQLQLTADDLRPLKEAVVQRFGFIILRDLQPENRTKSIYRGLKRSYDNWIRMVVYCQREQLSFVDVRQQVEQELVVFLRTELHDVSVKGGDPCINCTQKELQEYAENLDVDLDRLASGWQDLFPS